MPLHPEIRGGLLALTLLACPGLASPAAPAGAHRCPDHDTEIIGADPVTGAEACAATGDALGFLAGYGLTPRQGLRIRITDRPLTHDGYAAYGHYDAAGDRITVMSHQGIVASLPDPRMYDEPLDAAHFRGIIAHEVAHAVAHHNRQVADLSRAAQEYLAHATQLAVLPQARREAIIRAADVGPWESQDVISDIYMAMAPTRFAVKSYLHLTGEHDPDRFVQILLASRWFYINVP